MALGRHSSTRVKVSGREVSRWGVRTVMWWGSAAPSVSVDSGKLFSDRRAFSSMSWTVLVLYDTQGG